LQYKSVEYVIDWTYSKYLYCHTECCGAGTVIGPYASLLSYTGLVIKNTYENTVELNLYVLIGTVSHPDMQKIQIIGFFFENRLHWQFKVKKNLQMAILDYIFIYVQIQHYLGDDHKLSLLTRTLGIPCLIWEPLRLLLFTVCACI